MSLLHSPRIITNGLVFAYDQANTKSYKGPPIQNLANSISIDNTGTSTGYSSVGSTGVATIPELGPTTVYTNKIQNNYTAYSPNSTACCPSLFGGWGNITVSPSTLYTYLILYKCDSGYTNSNYMYRYEFTSSSGSLVAEGGVHNTANRVHLGEGWYYAWGTFTTQATTNWIGYCGLYYYKYSQFADTVSVAKVAIIQGNYSGLHPKYWPAQNSTRSNTQAIIDLTGNNTITANSLTYNTDGTFSFNGSNDYIDIANNLGTLSSYTISFWAKRDAENRMPIGWRGGPVFYWYGDNSWFYTHGGVYGEYYYSKPTSIPLGTWGHYCVVYNGFNVSIYRQGIFQGSQNTTGTADWTNGIRIGFWNDASGYYWQGKIDSVSMYNRALSAAEVKQNFNALRGRYGV